MIDERFKKGVDQFINKGVSYIVDGDEDEDVCDICGEVECDCYDDD